MPVKLENLDLKIIEYNRLILFSLNKNEYEYEYF